ncbi:MAG TPA: sigma 54-interacting transcriptional regulator, partial [Myxococcota bacterium]|nr:sigma 54-interacting transcriptional regulator [Myxococcota bacterium]
DVLRVAPLGIPVLILGESGVGKESLARAVHDAGGRKGPYRVLDLSTINESLVESELFGHVRGAFTGADRERQGAFRQAQGGTLFLDELGNLSPRVQAKLLRVLQEKLVFPVGGDSAFSVDVRVVAATNADLETMVARGLFREDLLRRLNAVTLVLPPLRERPEDIPLLAQHFAAQHQPPGSPPITTEALEILQRWPWPGNIRELGNVLARAAAEAGRGAIQPQHLGSLAPGGQRPVPLLSSASDEAWLRMEPYASDRSLSHQLTAVTLKLAPVRERGAGAIRNAVLSLLDGHPIRVEAMRLLERYPWWGNWTELEAAISALKANIPGIIDRESLEQTLPHLLRTGQEPIRVLLHPTIQHGSLKGFQQDFFEEALLVGRVGSLADALRLAAEDPSLEPRLEQLRARLRGAAPACLDLAQLPQLSRLHFLICREPEGLRLDVLAGARRGLWAGSLDEELRYVAPGTSLFLGRAGELQVRNDSGGPPALQMLSFAGAIAQEEGSEKAVQRLAAARQRPGRTV